MTDLNKVAGAVIILSLIAMLYLLKSDSNLNGEISDARATKKVTEKQLEIYSGVNNYFGRHSSAFYSNKPIVVLRGAGSTEVIRIYCENNTEGINASRDTSLLETKWGDSDGKWIPYTITSKVANGYTTVAFTNKANNDKFEVLVIIK